LGTKLEDGELAIALWNYEPPGGNGPAYTKQSALPGESRNFVLQLDHLGKMRSATIFRVDSTHSSSLALFDQMGRPENLTTDQIASLQKAGAMAAPEHLTVKDGRITTNVPPYGLVVLLIQK
jgi:xylan 1,4-beta-xylosidase